MQLPWDSAARSDHGGYDRPRSDSPYHTARWTRLSRAFRAMHPLCEECRKRGVIKSAAVVDHIVPWPVCQDFFDEKNLQSLCEDCNRAKGNRDKRIIREWRASHPGQKQ